MRANDPIPLLFTFSLLAVLITACGSRQMTAQEHREAAARENQLADENCEKITGENIEPPSSPTTAPLRHREIGV